MDLRIAVDRTTTIRASVHDVERTLVIAIALVVIVVFAFLRSGWATAIPGVAVPLSLLGTFGVMWFLGYSLDNLSLMALTISTALSSTMRSWCSKTSPDTSRKADPVRAALSVRAKWVLRCCR